MLQVVETPEQPSIKKSIAQAIKGILINGSGTVNRVSSGVNIAIDYTMSELSNDIAIDKNGNSVLLSK